MAKLNNPTQKNFTMVNNWAIYCKELSLKALGLYAKLSSLPDDWDFSEAGLTCLCSDGATSVKSALKELEEFNLLFRFRRREENGTLGEAIYYISDKPLDQQQKKEILAKYNSRQLLMIEQPILENPTLVFEDNIILNELNIKEIKENKKENNKSLIKDAIDYLNEKSGSSYRPESKVSIKLINSLVKQNFTLDEIKTVIDFKCNDWLNDEHMKQYLRPSTLFGNKFEEYLEASKNFNGTRLKGIELEAGVFQF